MIKSKQFIVWLSPLKQLRNIQTVYCVALILLGGVLGCEETAQEVKAKHYDAIDEAAIPERMRKAKKGTYPVTMAPMGTWHVDSPPEHVMVGYGIEIDMLMALGQIEKAKAMFHHTHYVLGILDEMFYSQLPGVKVDREKMMSLWQVKFDTETIYEMKPDLMMSDPRMMALWAEWDAQEMGVVTHHTGPVFGNSNSAFMKSIDQFGDPYATYNVYELFEVYAKLFKATHRYEKIKKIRDDLIDNVKKQLPPEKDRLPVCVINGGSNPAKGKFFIVQIPEEDIEPIIMHYHDLGIRQSEKTAVVKLGIRGNCDYETLAEIDPPIIFVHMAISWFKDQKDFEDNFVAHMRNHPIGSRLQAVKNNRVYPGGSRYQGPVVNLFQIEMTAKNLYPEIFGKWEWGKKPEKPLFDRQQLADAILGEKDE